MQVKERYTLLDLRVQTRNIQQRTFNLTFKLKYLIVNNCSWVELKRFKTPLKLKIGDE